MATVQTLNVRFQSSGIYMVDKGGANVSIEDSFSSAYNLVEHICSWQ